MGKKWMRFLGAFVGFLAVCSCFFACKSEAENAPAVPSYSILAYKSGDIIRNLVINLKATESDYYEYLEFTSENGGNYSVYKKEYGSSTTAPKEKVESYTNSSGKTVTVPSTFTYDSATGKISTTVKVSSGEGENLVEESSTVESYFFNYSFQDATTVYFAAEILSKVDESLGDTLYQSYKSSDGTVFTFNEDLTCSIVNEEQSINQTVSYVYENDLILDLLNFDMCYANINGTKKLYYPIYDSAQRTVDEVGKSLKINNSVIEFKSNGFILVDIFK